MSLDPSYVCIGHVCMDVKGEAYSLGGTVAFSSLTSNAMGFRSQVITSFGNDFLFDELLSRIEIINLPSEKTTIFENTYIENDREQIIKSRADRIFFNDVKDYLPKADIIHIAPIADETDHEIFNHLPKHALKIITPQGLMRQWGENGKIYQKRYEMTSSFHLII